VKLILNKNQLRKKKARGEMKSSWYSKLTELGQITFYTIPTCPYTTFAVKSESLKEPGIIS